MELQDWRKEPRKNYSNEFKLRMVELASQPGACVAQIARENGVNDNVIFKWLRLWQNEGRVSRRLPVTTSSDTGVELLQCYVSDVCIRPAGIKQMIYLNLSCPSTLILFILFTESGISDNCPDKTFCFASIISFSSF